jgi:hypothetical protein
MRQIFLLLSVLLLGLTWAVAQDSTGQTGSQTSAGGEMSVQGCLSGSSGSYTLTDKHGMSYQLTGDTAKLSEHVGHEVKITSTSSSEASSAGASSGTSSAAGSTGAQKTLQVSSVKHISKTCQSAGAMSH